MNKIFLPIAISFSLTSCSQNSKLEGRWLWDDSTKANIIVLDFRKGNIISRYAGPNNPINRDNFKNGKYSLKKDSVLVITWDDKTIEKYRISCSPKNNLIFTYGPDQGMFSNKKFSFALGKIKDEEVQKDELPPIIKN